MLIFLSVLQKVGKYFLLVVRETPEPVAEEPPAWAIFWLTAAAAAVAADTAEL